MRLIPAKSRQFERGYDFEVVRMAHRPRGDLYPLAGYRSQGCAAVAPGVARVEPDGHGNERLTFLVHYLCLRAPAYAGPDLSDQAGTYIAHDVGREHCGKPVAGAASR